MSHTVRSGWRLSCFDKFLHSKRYEVAVVQHVTSAQLLNVDWEGLIELLPTTPQLLELFLQVPLFLQLGWDCLAPFMGGQAIGNT